MVFIKNGPIKYLTNQPNIFIQGLIHLLSLAVACALITAGIVIGVIIGIKQINSFTKSRIILETSSFIVLNRFIEPYELPYFYNATETVDTYIKEIKKTLADAFGSKFVTIKVVTFSLQPNLTSIDSEQHTLSITTTTTTLSTSPTEHQNIPSIDEFKQMDKLSIDSDAFIQASIESSVFAIRPWQNDTIGIYTITNCRKRENNLVNCINQTIPADNCTRITNDTINCNNMTITAENCTELLNETSNLPAFSNTTTPQSATIINNTRNECIISNNITRQSSIISSETYFYFSVNENEYISSEEIFKALKNFKPLITLFTRCNQSSSMQSSFNTTWSQVEQTIEINIDLNFLKSQSIISTELQNAINNAPHPSPDEFSVNTMTQQSDTCMTFT